MLYKACKGVKLAGENYRGIEYRDIEPVLTIIHLCFFFFFKQSPCAEKDISMWP